MGKGQTQTQTVSPDDRTQDFINQYRNRLTGLDPAAGDYGYDAARKALVSNFDRQRGLAGVNANQQATAAGAFGGDRHAILQAELMGGVNRDETNALASLGMSEADALWSRIMGQLQLMGDASRLGGMKTRNHQSGNLFGDLLGAGLTIGGMALGGPAGAAVAGGGDFKGYV